MNISCDNCKKQFYLEPQIKTLEADIEQVYIKCPHCHTEFTSHYSNDDIKKLQAEVRALSKVIEESKTRKEKRKLIRELESLQKKMKKEMDWLRKKIESPKTEGKAT